METISGLFNVVAIGAVLALFIGLIKPTLFKDQNTGKVPTRKLIATGSVSLFFIETILYFSGIA